MTTRLLDTLARINAAAPTASPTTKIAAQPIATAPVRHGDLLRKLAAAIPTSAPAEVTDADLYDVLKVATTDAPLPPYQVDGSSPGDQLRKLAYALRVADIEARELRREKAAHMIVAAQGLTLLRDRVRAL